MLLKIWCSTYNTLHYIQYDTYTTYNTRSVLTLLIILLTIQYLRYSLQLPVDLNSQLPVIFLLCILNNGCMYVCYIWQPYALMLPSLAFLEPPAPHARSGQNMYYIQQKGKQRECTFCVCTWIIQISFGFTSILPNSVVIINAPFWGTAINKVQNKLIIKQSV